MLIEQVLCTYRTGTLCILNRYLLPVKQVLRAYCTGIYYILNRYRVLI